MHIRVRLCSNWYRSDTIIPPRGRLLNNWAGVCFTHRGLNLRLPGPISKSSCSVSASPKVKAHSDIVPFKMCPQGTKPARCSVWRLAMFFGLHRAAGTLPSS